MLLIVETPLFTKQIMTLATDEEYRALQEVVVANPAAGNLIPSGGGIRKVRMAKSVKTNLSPAEISMLRELVKALGR